MIRSISTQLERKEMRLKAFEIEQDLSQDSGELGFPKDSQGSDLEMPVDKKFTLKGNVH